MLHYLFEVQEDPEHRNLIVNVSRVVSLLSTSSQIKIATSISSYTSKNSKQLVRELQKMFMAAEWKDPTVLSDHQLVKFLMTQGEDVLQSFVSKVIAMSKEDALSAAFEILNLSEVSSSFSRAPFLCLARFFFEVSSDLSKQRTVLMKMIKYMNALPGDSGNIIQIILFAFSCFKQDNIER